MQAQRLGIGGSPWAQPDVRLSDFTELWDVL
jgi:hypothetical protein